MPVVVACLVPAAPLLLPALTGPRVPEVDEVRSAVARALARLAGLDRVVVVAQALRGSLAGFGAPAGGTPAGWSGAGGYQEGLPEGGSWPHELALALLDRTPGAPSVRGRRCWADGHEEDLLGADDGGRTGLLLLADGSRTRGPRAPGGDDPRGGAVDAELADALREGRVAAAPDADAVGATALPAVSLLSRLPGRTQLLHEAAPLGVCYLVAVRSTAPGPGR